MKTYSYPRLSAILLFLLAAIPSWGSNDLYDMMIKPDDKSASSQAQPAPVPAQGMLLQSYQLHNMHVGEAGRATEAFSILQQILPPGSEIRQDPQSNSFHIMTTKQAHDAVIRFLASLDVPSQSPSAQIPDEVKKTLDQLVEGNEAAQKALAKYQDTASQLGVMQANQQKFQAETQKYLLIGGGVIGGILVLGLFLVFRSKKVASGVPARQSGELTIAPAQVALALKPLQEEMRVSAMNELNKTVIAIQALYEENRREKQEQLALQESHTAELQRTAQTFQTMMQESQRETRESIENIGRQADKVASTVDELQRTVSELDQVKGSLFQAQEENIALQRELTAARRETDAKAAALARREREVAVQQATLAALQVTLEEEGASIEDGAIAAEFVKQSDLLNQPVVLPPESSSVAQMVPEVVNETAPEGQPESPSATIAPVVLSPSPSSKKSTLRFTFLPPSSTSKN